MLSRRGPGELTTRAGVVSEEGPAVQLFKGDDHMAGQLWATEERLKMKERDVRHFTKLRLTRLCKW